MARAFPKLLAGATSRAKRVVMRHYVFANSAIICNHPGLIIHQRMILSNPVRGPKVCVVFDYAPHCRWDIRVMRQLAFTGNKKPSLKTLTLSIVNRIILKKFKSGLFKLEKWPS